MAVEFGNRCLVVGKRSCLNPNCLKEFLRRERIREETLAKYDFSRVQGCWTRYINPTLRSMRVIKGTEKFVVDWEVAQVLEGMQVWVIPAKEQK